jgi:molybdopterin synthase catalytic subunit
MNGDADRSMARIVDGPVPAHPFAVPPTAGAGGVLTFHGVVRPLEEGREIRGLDYETYDPMAERMLGELAADAVERFALLGFRVLHSRGFVSVGAASLVAEARGAHRKETLDAMAWYIHRMKEDVPIWKRAVFADGGGVGRDGGSP